jgi:nucleotide-binding universal stress UspA family protein
MDTIVCAIDCSPADQGVVDRAVMFARRMKAQLWLFHAIHTPSDSLHPNPEFERGGELHRLEKMRRIAIEQLMATVDIPWRCEIVHGEPVESIESFCRMHAIDLVVAGSRGIRGLKRLMYGTVVQRMARTVWCPLLVVPVDANAAAKIDRLGICCDLSDHTRDLVAWGVDLARAFDADVNLLHAMAAPDFPELIEPSGSSYEQAQRTMETHVRERLLAMVSAARAPGDVSAHLVRGEAKNRIPQLAAALRIDLLLVGVRPHGAFGRWVVGSTTEAVLRKAVCPILAVPVPS